MSAQAVVVLSVLMLPRLTPNTHLTPIPGREMESHISSELARNYSRVCAVEVLPRSFLPSSRVLCILSQCCTISQPFVFRFKTVLLSSPGQLPTWNLPVSVSRVAVVINSSLGQCG